MGFLLNPKYTLEIPEDRGTYEIDRDTSKVDCDTSEEESC